MPGRHARVSTSAILVLLLAPLAFVATDSQIRVPPADTSAQSHPASETLKWNRRARALVARDRVDPARASRLYAVLSLAQHEAALRALDLPRDADSADVERVAISFASVT